MKTFRIDIDSETVAALIAVVAVPLVAWAPLIDNTKAIALTALISGAVGLSKKNNHEQSNLPYFNPPPTVFKDQPIDPLIDQPLHEPLEEPMTESEVFDEALYSEPQAEASIQELLRENTKLLNELKQRKP